MSDSKGRPTARLTTSEGTIVIRLFEEEAPQTVANFIGLAEGSKQWMDPATGKPSNDSLYKGTIFHRVIDGFMVQGGCPLGTGRGGPGYTFDDEIDPKLRFDKPFLLAMANTGQRGTNGSQFFITVGEPDWLNGRHTIFGEVVEGSDVVTKISTVKTDPNDRPLTDIVIESVEITR